MNNALLIIELALKSTLLFGAVWLVNAALRRLSAAERHALWVSTLVGLLALPPIALLAPAVEVPLPAIGATLAGDDALGPRVGEPSALNERPSGATVPEAATGGTREAFGTNGATRYEPVDRNAGLLTARTVVSAAGSTASSAIVAGVYVAVAIALLAALAFALARVSLSLRRLLPLHEPRTLALLESVRAEARLRRRIRLLRSRTDATPWVWGWLRPVIVVPANFTSWPRAAQRDALLHEVAHVARFDFLTALLGYVCRALYWFQPLVWIAVARMHREAERACDDRVLIASSSRSGYAGQLLDLAASLERSQHGRVAGCAMATRSGLSERVTSILDSNQRRTGMGHGKSALVLTITAALVLIVGTLKTTADTQAQQTPDPTATPADLESTPDVATIAARGPRDSEELELVVIHHLAESRQAEAVRVLEEYIWPYGYGSTRSTEFDDRLDANCAFCRAVLETDWSLTEWTRRSHTALPSLLSAFDRIEQQSMEAHDGNPLIALANMTSETRVGAVARDGLAQWYLLEAFRLGDLTDRSKLRAVVVLAYVHWYEQGKALAEHLYSDTSSSLYQSPAVQQWMRFLDSRVQRINDGGARLLAAGTGGADPDAEYLPMVRVAALYPTDATEEQLEGFAMVEFTVDQRGRTRNVQAIQSSNPIFEQPAVDAALQFRYAPRIVNGTPIDVQGVRNVFTFRAD